MKKKTSIFIGIVLLAAGLCFAGYSMLHPEASFPWSNRITFLLYGVYIWLVFDFLLVIPLFRREQTSAGSLAASLLYLFMAIIFFAMEVTDTEEADVFTILRGFVVSGALDMAVQHARRWFKSRHA